MISSSRADLISRSSKLQMYPDVWIGSCKFKKRTEVWKQSNHATPPAVWTLTSGSRFLKTYILVFSIMENKSGLSFAHFMSQTSLRSNFDGSPADGWAPASSSNRVITPAMSIMARRLQTVRFCFKQLQHICTAHTSKVPYSIWYSPSVAVEWQIVWSVV